MQFNYDWIVLNSTIGLNNLKENHQLLKESSYIF